MAAISVIGLELDLNDITRGHIRLVNGDLVLGGGSSITKIATDVFLASEHLRRKL